MMTIKKTPEKTNSAKQKLDLGEDEIKLENSQPDSPGCRFDEQAGQYCATHMQPMIECNYMYKEYYDRKQCKTPTISLR